MCYSALVLTIVPYLRRATTGGCPYVYIIFMRIFQFITKHLTIALLSLLFSLLILAGCIYFYMVFKLPDVATLKDTHLQVPLRIYSRDGQLIAEYGAMRRNPVTLDRVPKQLLNAIIATEDQRFFEHPGVDIWGVLRAAREMVVTGQRSQGASTISMQVARNFFLTPEKTFSRKINEVLLALKINATFSKETILELYLNKIYLGQHAYGVSAAAQIYYGKSLSELSLPEMATIAGLPQAPSKENPISNPTAAKIRRDHVLARMLEENYIDRKDYEAATQAPILTYYHGPKTTVSAPHIAEMVRNVIYQQFGDAGYTRGLRVITTIDSHLQQAANTALRDGLIAYDRRHRGYRGAEKNLGLLPEDLSLWENTLGDMPQADVYIPAAVIKVEANKVTATLANGLHVTIPASGYAWTQRKAASLFKVGDVIRVLQKENGWELVQIPTVQGALVSLDPSNGAILALNGGFSDSDSGFNRVIQANRQPGSSFKPFIYAAALAKGYTLATIINDAPLAINDTGDPNNLWRPQNDDKQFHGPTRLRIGLVKSLNLVTIRILQMIEIPYAVDYATRFGFTRENLPPFLSLALGTASVTPMQMATAYSVFANGGYLVTPYFIQQIQAENNSVLYQASPPVVPEYYPDAVAQLVAPRVIESDIAYMMNNALRDVIQSGTGFAANELKRADIGGKTGTSNGNFDAKNRQVDAWFSGFNRHVETTVWVGFDQQTKPLGEYGGQVSLPIWIDYMRVALAGQPQETMPPPDTITTARIDPNTGLLAQPDQPNAILEIFRTDTVPTESAPTAAIPQDNTNYYFGDETNPGNDTIPNNATNPDNGANPDNDQAPLF